MSPVPGPHPHGGAGEGTGAHQGEGELAAGVPEVFLQAAHLHVLPADTPQLGCQLLLQLQLPGQDETPPRCRMTPPPTSPTNSVDSSTASGSPSLTPAPLPVDEEGGDGDGQEDEADDEGQDLQGGQAGCAVRGGR